MTKKLFNLSLLVLTLATNTMLAQSDNPVEYMNYFTNNEEALSKNYLSYMSEVAHGERARKMEKRRAELINSIKGTIRETNKLKPYKGDISLRNAYSAYWNILLSIFNEDYHKIVDMEEVAEQSYDAMEAYLLAQDKASEKLHEAHDKVAETYNAFAASHNVRLVEGQSTKLSRKIKQASDVNAYSQILYLIFFKASVQELYAMNALKANDINGLEQSRGSLLKYAEEGLAKLDTVKPYKGDGSLITATTKVLNFYKQEATKDLTVFADFLIKNDEMEKLRKSYEAKSSGKTQADVQAYNKSVADFNKLIETYNKTSQQSNNARADVINNFNITKKRFMDAHVPYK